MKGVSISLFKAILDALDMTLEHDYLQRLLPALKENFRVIASIDELDLEKSVEPSSYLALLFLGDDHERL